MLLPRVKAVMHELQKWSNDNRLLRALKSAGGIAIDDEVVDKNQIFFDRLTTTTCG